VDSAQSAASPSSSATTGSIGRWKFSEALQAPDADYLDIPQIDILKAAEANGIPATHVDTLDELSDVVNEGMTAGSPRLVEVFRK
jgi:thiamine pyrophosphate-dependent acetolactate synthase large subunit-like protein